VDFLRTSQPLRPTTLSAAVLRSQLQTQLRLTGRPLPRPLVLVRRKLEA